MLRCGQACLVDAGAVAAALAEGGAVGATNAAGWSPLHHAAQIGAPPSLTKLMD